MGFEVSREMTVAVTGTFLGSEHKSGNSTNAQTGVVEPYAYEVAHILIGVEVTHARIDEAFRMADLPEVGEVFRCELKVSAYRANASAELAARLLSRLPLLPAAV
jgi:hypothetical protein